MDKLIFNHPLRAFFKGSVEHKLDEHDQQIFSIRLSNKNFFYAFQDYTKDDDGESNVLEQTMSTLAFIIEKELDIMIETDSGYFYDAKKLLEKFNSMSAEDAAYFVHSVYISFLVTDKNTAFIKSLVETIELKDFDHSVSIMEKNNRLIFEAISIPNYYLIDDEFINGELKNITSTFKNIEKEINDTLKNVDLSVSISVFNYEEHYVSVKMSTFISRKKGLAKLNDKNRSIFNDVISKFIKGSIKIRQKRMKTTIDHEGDLCINHFSFDVTKRANEGLFNGSLC